MEQLDRDWVLKGHIPLAHAGDMIGLTHPEFRTWLDILGVRSDHARLNANVFELYRIDLVRRLLALGYAKEEIQQLPLHIQRSILNNQHMEKRAWEGDCSAVLEAAEQLDKWACLEAMARIRAHHGPVRFALDVAPVLMQDVGKRWWHGRAAVYQEHFLTAALRSHLSAIMLDQKPHAQPALRTIVTTPCGELHEIGALIAAIIAQDAGHDTVYLGAQLPVAEVMQAVDCLDAHVVCLASSFLDARRLEPQIRQLREVLPSHVVLCLGGSNRLDQTRALSMPRTLLYDDLPSFDADMRAFARIVHDWLPK